MIRPIRRRHILAAVATVAIAAGAFALPGAGHSCRYNGALPDSSPGCTPGALNPDVTQDTIAQTICVSGWTATVRPPTSYTDSLKRQQMAAYGAAGTPADYEEDHRVPLAVGGAPTDPRNLWPEPLAAAKLKDQVEVRTQRAICDATTTLADGRAIFLRGTWGSR